MIILREMKGFAIFPVAASLLLALGCAGGIKTVRSRSFDPATVKRVAVSALRGPDAEVGESVSDSLVPDLMDMGFTVVERGQLERVLKEQSLQLTGAVDPATLKEVGRIAGVDAILVGDFSSHKERTVSRRRMTARRRLIFRRPLLMRGRITVTEGAVFDSLVLRLVSVTTGEVLLSSSKRGSFDGSDLESVLDEMAKGMKKALK